MRLTKADYWTHLQRNLLATAAQRRAIADRVWANNENVDQADVLEEMSRATARDIPNSLWRLLAPLLPDADSEEMYWFVEAETEVVRMIGRGGADTVPKFLINLISYLSRPNPTDVAVAIALTESIRAEKTRTAAEENGGRPALRVVA